VQIFKDSLTKRVRDAIQCLHQAVDAVLEARSETHDKEQTVGADVPHRGPTAPPLAFDEQGPMDVAHDSVSARNHTPVIGATQKDVAHDAAASSSGPLPAEVTPVSPVVELPTSTARKPTTRETLNAISMSLHSLVLDFTSPVLDGVLVDRASSTSSRSSSPEAAFFIPDTPVNQPALKHRAKLNDLLVRLDEVRCLGARARSLLRLKSKIAKEVEAALALFHQAVEAAVETKSQAHSEGRNQDAEGSEMDDMEVEMEEHREERDGYDLDPRALPLSSTVAPKPVEASPDMAPLQLDCVAVSLSPSFFG
jgi:hypothetical protein